jgi:hypothetical protein
MKIKKLILIAIGLAVLLSTLLGSTVMAAPAGKDIPANENPNNLYLYPKVYADAPEWTTLWEAEAWGKYNFKLDGQIISGVFNGHGLTPGEDYTLLSYNDPWASSPQFVIIGNGTVNDDGNIHINIKEPVDLGEDVASPIYDWSGPGDGYKIWLVLTEDIDPDTSAFIAWNPDSYLFENNRIGATATAP